MWHWAMGSELHRRIVMTIEMARDLGIFVLAAAFFV
jgi:hypothetical protein